MKFKKLIDIMFDMVTYINGVLATYEDKYFKTKRGKGVAFTIPISSVIGVMVYKFLLNVNEG